MKHLYIIGNGFDIFSGLNTRFEDFREWVKCNYPFVYEELQKTYHITESWWGDFEYQLGKLNIPDYLQRFTPQEPSEIEILQQIEENQYYKRNGSGIPSLYNNKSCSNRLRGLLDILHYCLSKWVENISITYNAKNIIKIIIEDSYFINFNYTDTLELIYNIPENQVYHIHGRASKHEKLIFGHSGNHVPFNLIGHEQNGIRFELNSFEKNPYEYIFKAPQLPIILKDVKQIHVYGFSFSQVDEDYMDWIFHNTPNNSKWEISYYTLEDKNRIENFISKYPGLSERQKIIKLKNLEITL